MDIKDEILRKLNQAHKLLTQSSMSTKEYTPISELLIAAKFEITQSLPSITPKTIFCEYCGEILKPINIFSITQHYCTNKFCMAKNLQLKQPE